jgi:protocatechuate 3,4-dioxygenase beta subunit
MYRYQLAQSKEGTIKKDNEEINLNLVLEENKYYNNALISGYILQNNGEPVKEALISFINEDNKNLGSIYSDSKGFYVFIGVPKGETIKIIIEKRGFRKTISELINVICESYRRNFYLTKNCKEKSSIISGHIRDSENKPLENIFVYLIFFDDEKNKYLIKTTVTNAWGQFVFYGVIEGKKKILINDARFQEYKHCLYVDMQEEIYNINVNLIPKTSVAIIQGYLRDATGMPVPYAHAILFRKDEEGQLKAIAHTICDYMGQYKFKDITKGKYVVKGLR